jgi:hypothetical protein
MRDDQIYQCLRINNQELVKWVQTQNKVLNMQLLFFRLKLKFYEELLGAPIKMILNLIIQRLMGPSNFDLYLKAEYEKFQAEEVAKCSLENKNRKETPAESL